MNHLCQDTEWYSAARGHYSSGYFAYLYSSVCLLTYGLYNIGVLMYFAATGSSLEGGSQLNKTYLPLYPILWNRVWRFFVGLYLRSSTLQNTIFLLPITNIKGNVYIFFNLNFSRIQNQRVPLIFVLGIKYCMWIGKVSQSMTPESFPQIHPIILDILIN